jgi:hypothetical protein
MGVMVGRLGRGKIHLGGLGAVPELLPRKPWLDGREFLKRAWSGSVPRSCDRWRACWAFRIYDAASPELKGRYMLRFDGADEKHGTRLAAAYHIEGVQHLEEARAAVQRLLAIAPETTIARVRAYLEAERSVLRGETLSQFLEGLRRAGLPE